MVSQRATQRSASPCPAQPCLGDAALCHASHGWAAHALHPDSLALLGGGRRLCGAAGCRGKRRQLGGINMWAGCT